MKRTIIACSIFESELTNFLEDHAADVEIKWLQAGLHCDLDLLEKSLVPMMDETVGSEHEPRLLIGDGCLPHMKDLAKAREIPLLKSKNCVEALLGEERLRELERNRTMVITPAWIRKVFLAPNGTRAILGWDDTDFKINFGRYDRFLVLDSGLDSLSDEETLDFFSIAEVPIETEELDLNRFKEVMTEFLA
ncbi:MAG: DUF1638 domain-containing protein [Deltaproteobacteria bacterium]|jgi:hypothetical protein|nr:DUF1638 domain-containing protein [Deltaproteobacteria bacterium]